MPHLLKVTGEPVTGERAGQCDGCGKELPTVTADMEIPVPLSYARAIYDAPPGSLFYVACDRGSLCVDLALLADELWLRTRCNTPGCDIADCDGSRCPPREETDVAA